MNDNVYINLNNRTKWLALYTSKSNFINYCLEHYADEYMFQKSRPEPRVEPDEGSV
jgi:hypothetical protein